MPLVRVAVRNEFGLGQPELCREANKEDPKAVLDAFSVSGLVGILRQLGDLAEFAAEVFHGLQEQVTTTASRSHKLIVRLQHIDAALSPLERAILAQTNHIHFAYTSGSEWHAHIKNGQNHFIYNDLPRFIMDSYEECRDPPRLHLLDKFDPGGPGSCLKRYSDPTFFKRASAHSNEAYAEKIQKDKKAHIRNKKKRSKRNGELLRGESVSNHSGRMQFISPIANERTSPSQTASTVDMILKSDLGDHSNSFDSKNGSGYIECVFDMGSSMQPEEQESKELSSSRLTQLNDMFELVSPGEQTGFQDDKFSHSSSQEKIAPSPSCAAWDEKPEIDDPKGQQCDGDEDIGRFPSNPELDSQDVRIAELQNVDQMEILFGDENTLKSISCSYQVHEIESEPDNYVDALNTIESESENDLDCQTKREVEHYPSSVKNEGMVYGMHEFTEHNSNPHASESESHTASDIYPNKGMPLDLSDSVPSESFITEHTPQIAGKSSYSDHSPGSDLCGSAGFLDGSRLESIINDTSSSCLKISGSQDQSGDKIIHSFDQSQESLAEFSGGRSVQFWTNGGLLGLEPSKPSDFTVSNGATQDSVSRNKNQTVVPLNHTLILNGDGHKVQLDMLENTEITKSTLCSTSCHDQKDGNTEKTSWGLSQADEKFENSGNSLLSNINQTSAIALNEIRIMAPESALSTAPDVKTTTIHSNKENDEDSQIFGLSHRLLLNGFRRKMSLVRDDKSKFATSITTGVLEPTSEHHGVAYQKTSETTFKELFGHGSSEDSPSSSPPLEHMKISFHPVNGFEISKLKLKIPNGTQSHESTGDMFSSFQLVPEPAITLHDIDSDSDGDTFCRSSPYTLDDCLSDHSESNSEQWDSGEILGSKDHEIYDDIGRITLVESTSSSLELRGMAGNGICSEGGLKSVHSENGVKHSLNGHLVDLPNFDDVNCVLQGDIKYDSNPKSLLKLHYPRELATLPPPPPPPLPPVEWRVSKTHLDLAEEKQNVSEAFKHAFDLKILQSTVSQQPKTAPTEQQLTNEEDIAFKPKSKQPDQHLLNGQKVADQGANGKETGEREDFLQQIRTKSFNLRHTVASMPTITQVPPAGVKVTAILEKASAIRQAVGSDDGEDDDNWSNT